MRRATGLKVGSFSELVECSAPHLTSCENGHRDPSPELAERIAREVTRLLGRKIEVKAFMPRPAIGGGGNTPDKPPPQPRREPKATPKRQDTERTKGPRRNAEAAA